MEYKSGRQVKSGTRRRSAMVWITLALVAILMGGALTAGFFHLKDLQGLYMGLLRIRNTFSFFVLGQKPHFYALIVEKNGKDYRLTSRDFFEVSYRDEFVIKEVSTDVLFGGGVTVDVDGLGGKDDFGKLLKGIDLVDKTVLADRKGGGETKRGSYTILVNYKEDLIGSIPIRVQITPQDWLRYARSSGNQKVQIEYLKKAIAMNPGDANVRKMLASLYMNAGMTGEAIRQYQEMLVLKPDDSEVMTELAKCYLKV